MEKTIIRDHDKAFRNAIEAGRFRMFGKGEDLVDNWMYMYSKPFAKPNIFEGVDVFKNKANRQTVSISY